MHSHYLYLNRVLVLPIGFVLIVRYGSVVNSDKGVT